jgi:hypothetical protein
MKSVNLNDLKAVLAATGLVLLAGCAKVQTLGRAAQPVAPAKPDEIALNATRAAGPETTWTRVKGQRVKVAVRNDSLSLSVLVRFPIADTFWARNCDMQGLNVWFVAPGMDTNEFGLNFSYGPFSSGPQEEHKLKPGEEKIPASGGTKSRHLLNGGLYVLSGDRSQYVNPDGSMGPSAQYSLVNDTCTYALTLPTRHISDQHLGLNLEPGKTVLLRLTAGITDDFGRMTYWREVSGEGPKVGQGAVPPRLEPPSSPLEFVTPAVRVRVTLAR